MSDSFLERLGWYATSWKFDWHQKHNLYAAALGFILYKWLRSPTRVKVPAMGPTFPGLSYLGAFKFMRDAASVLQQGYSQYRGNFFQVALVDGWMVVAAGGKNVTEITCASEDQLSFLDAVNDFAQIEIFLGTEVIINQLHAEVVRSRLTRNLVTLFPDIKDEIAAACDDEIHLNGSEWTKIKALDTNLRIISRTSNRIFIGLPLCRDPDFRDLNIHYTTDAALGAMLINAFPDTLKPFVAKYCTNVPRTIARSLKHLAPVIEERRAMNKEDRPNDFLSWMMEHQTGREESAEILNRRMLSVNFAAIHTTSTALTHALYYLAANPEKYMQPLRDEIEDVVAEYGWSKLALGKMRKLDSFLKETQRLKGLAPIGLARKARKDYTFSDGTFIPKNTLVVAAVGPIQTDPEIYGPDAHTFDGFRFAEMREEEGEEIKHQMVNTSNEFLPFGHGKHACPGRFFAVTVLKCIMAHFLLNYDIKLENEGVRPKDMLFGVNCIPNRTAEVLFRRRN